MKKIKEKLQTFCYWFSLLSKIFKSRITFRHLMALEEGRNPFPAGPPMDLVSQFNRFKSMFALLDVKYNISHQENEPYDIRESRNQKSRLILVPNDLTISEFIESINNSSHIPFNLVLDESVKVDCFEDVRSNAENSYLLYLNEHNPSKGAEETILLTETTLLETILLYAIKYFDTGEFTNEDVVVVCRGSKNGEFFATIKLTDVQVDKATIRVLIDKMRLFEDPNDMISNKMHILENVHE